MSDLIDREALLRQIDIDSEGEPGYYGDTWKFIDTIKNMPNVHDLPKDTDTISRQAAIETVMECYDNDELFEVYEDKLRELPPAQPEQLEPDQNGDLWITVPDIDEVTCVYVQENKSKFCRIFYEEQEQPERIIHCKDCEWWTKQECSPQGRCALSGMYPTGGWFCGNARRREVTT